MSVSIDPTKLLKEVQSLLTVETSPLGIDVTTPVLYPNGDFIVVSVAVDAGAITVHDAGLGGMYVALEGGRATRELANRMSLAAKRFDCQVEEGRVLRICKRDDVALSITLVANASRAISDFTVEARRQTDSQFRYVVTESLRELVGSRLRENESFKGKSGRSYRVQNLILDRFLREPEFFVVPLSSRNSVPIQFRELYDLKAAHEDVRNESVYDDAGDFRPDEDGWIMEQVGSVTPISKLREHLSVTLTAQ